MAKSQMLCTILLAVGGLETGSLQAQDASGIGITEPSIATSFLHNADPYGTRKWLYEHGVSSNFIYTNDVLSNLSGGIKRGTIDQGKLEAQLYIDLEKFAGWKNWTFYANAFGIYNDGRIRRDYVGGMNTIAAIEATPTVRLSELWLERWFGPVSLRFGQLAADAEFFYSDLSQIFLQSDWPTIGAVNLPGGGPAYPLSAVGARIKYEFPKDASLLFAIFNGDPAPPCPNADPDTCNRHGVNFRLSDPAFMIGEFQWRRNRGKDDAGLATTLKFGGWGHLGQFADQQFTNNGMLLANPASNGMPLMHRGDYGVYGVIDQQIYRPPGGDANSGISVFNRSAISPSDRNLVNVESMGRDDPETARRQLWRKRDLFAIFQQRARLRSAADQLRHLVDTAAGLRDESGTDLCGADHKGLGRAAGLYLHLASERHRCPLSRRADRRRAVDY